MKKLIILCFSISFCFCLSTNGQGYDPSKVKKKAIPLFEKALELSQDGDFPQAIKLLEESVTIDPAYLEAWLLMAAVHGTGKEYAKSIAAYEKSFHIDSNYSFEYLLPYSINLAGMGRFNEAAFAIEKLLARERINPNTKKAAEYRQKTYRFALAMNSRLTDTSYRFQPINLGDAVNSAESEYFPSVTIDGGELVFTRRVGNFNEDFFASQSGNDGWQNAAPLGGQVNTSQNEGAQMISQDGQWLVFTACNRPDGFGSCDIYISYLTPQGWSAAINLGGNINTDQWESQPCLSPDKRELYFASRRFGGYGGSDIYVSRMNQNGRWSEPENLGPAINTSGDEASPFLHADNQTLYFTSNGLEGYGKEDIFLTRRVPGGEWSKPENLGYPVNTIDSEGTLFITAGGDLAYYASDRSDTRGGLDLYSFKMPPHAKPRETYWVRGKVYDAKTGKGLPSAVELVDLDTRQTLSRLQTDETGNYLMTLPMGSNYAFNVNRKGYLFYSENLSLKLNRADSTYEKDIPLQPIETDASIVLRNIFFDFNSYELRPESEVELNRLVMLLNENPTLRIQIEGHTDNIGSDADNQKLSENRAKAVVDYLIQNGIAASRLSFKGFGASRPVSENESEQGRALNRRTEMKVIKQ